MREFLQVKRQRTGGDAQLLGHGSRCHAQRSGGHQARNARKRCAWANAAKALTAAASSITCRLSFIFQ